MNDVLYLLAMDHGTLISTGIDTSTYFKKRIFQRKDREAIKNQMIRSMRQYVTYDTDIWLVDGIGRVLVVVSCKIQEKVYGE